MTRILKEKSINYGYKNNNKNYNNYQNNNLNYSKGMIIIKIFIMINNNYHGKQHNNKN